MSEPSYQDRLLKVIPGGAHTYSRGFDQYPSNAPQIFLKAKGAYTYTPDNQEFLDYGMALRAVTIGYAEEEINQAAFKQIEYGNNLTRPSIVELEAAELITSLIGQDMVKFAKNGSAAVSAAVKLSRAYTGKELVARCAQHPFFSYDDWFIGSTPVQRGIPKSTIESTKSFNYNDLESLERLIDQFPNQFACVVLEPSVIDHPKQSTKSPHKNFLHDVQDLCKKHGIVFILDEMITGFRWHIKGAQHYYSVKPDLCTFGKAMANGFSVAAIAGKKEIMQLGSIEFDKQERTFLLSTTHGAEMSSLGAFIATINYLEKHQVIKHLWNYGEKLIKSLNQIIEKNDLSKSLSFHGIACSPVYSTLNLNGEPCLGLRTLLNQELIKNGVLMPWIALCYRHTDKELEKTINALENSINIYKKGYYEGYEKYLNGPAIKPVFRKYN